MPTTSKPRIHYIDFMKGLCILFIVISHTDDTLFALAGKNLNFTLESFRIPMYYFISGIFFKLYDGFGDFTRRKVNNIIVPMVFFFLASVLFRWLGQYLPPAQHYYGDFKWSMLWQPLSERQWDCNVPLWFLLSLFEVNIIYYLLQKLLPNHWWVALVALVMAAGGYACAMNHIGLPLLLDTALVGLPYFILGSSTKRLGGLAERNFDRWGWVALLVVLLVLYPFAQDINILQQRLPAYLYLYLIPPIAILALFWACKPLPYIPVINYIGRYSIVVLCTHYPLIRPLHRMVKTMLLKQGIHDEALTSVLMLVLLLVIELLFIWSLTRLLPWFTAQKPLFGQRWRPAWLSQKNDTDGN